MPGNGLNKYFVNLFRLYGYQEVRTPVLEPTALFSRSIGEMSDIVSKEMYSFEDRGGELVTLRPEGTASVARAGLQHGLFHNQQHRFWYQGPMFRYERPQKRPASDSFTRWAWKVYGWSGADIEAEVLVLSSHLWDLLGIERPVLQINSLGSVDSRQDYLDSLKKFLTPLKDELDDDSQKRLDSNVLRILDSKSKATQSVLEGAPSILDFLAADEVKRFEDLQAMLRDLDIEFDVNPRLVRGLDYYNDTVFEWVHGALGGAKHRLRRWPL